MKIADCGLSLSPVVAHVRMWFVVPSPLLYDYTRWGRDSMWSSAQRFLNPESGMFILSADNILNGQMPLKSCALEHANQAFEGTHGLTKGNYREAGYI